MCLNKSRSVSNRTTSSSISAGLRKLVTDLSEAVRLFSEAVAVNYKQTAQEKASEVDEEGEESASDEGNDEDGIPDINDADSLSEEVEVSLTFKASKARLILRLD